MFLPQNTSKCSGPWITTCIKSKKGIRSTKRTIEGNIQILKKGVDKIKILSSLDFNTFFQNFQCCSGDFDFNPQE